MTTAIQGRPRLGQRPSTLNWAIGLLLINGLGPIPLLPTVNGVDGFIVAATVGFAVLFVIGAWGLWNCWKWAAIATVVVTGINLLLSFGSIFTAEVGTPDAIDRILGVVGTVMCAAIIALILARPSRKVLR